MKSGKNENSTFIKVLLLTIIIILLSINIGYQFTNNNQPILFKLKLVPLSLNNKIAYSIDPNSVNSFEKILSRYNNKITNEFLINSLESQRNFFIAIITVLSLLVALVGIYSLIQKYFDKEHENYLIKLIDDAKNQIIKIKSDRAKTEIASYTAQVRQRIISCCYLDDGTIVNNVSTYNQYVIEKLKQTVPFIINENNFIYPIQIVNLIFSLNEFAIFKTWCKDDYDLKNNIVLSNIFNYLFATLDTSDFNLIKNHFVKVVKEQLGKEVVI